MKVYYVDVEIKHLSSTGFYITKDYGKDVKNKDGKVEKLRLFHQRENIPLPENTSVERYKKGRLKLNVLRDQQGQYTFLNTNTNYKILEPVTRNDRAFYIDEIEKSETKKRSDLTSFIFNMTCVIILGLVIAGHFIFWDKIAGSASGVREFELKQKELEVQQAQIIERTSQNLNEIVTGTRFIGDTPLNETYLQGDG